MRLLLIASLTFGMLTLQRTLKKYNHNKQQKSGHDEFLVMAVKGLIVLFATGAAYVFATILPMFVGLFISSYAALLSTLSVLNVPELVAASFAAFYTTNIVTVFVKTQSDGGQRPLYNQARMTEVLRHVDVEGVLCPYEPGFVLGPHERLDS